MKPSCGEYEEKAHARFVLFAINYFCLPNSAASRLFLREADWLLWATPFHLFSVISPAIKEKQVVSPLSSVGKFNPAQSKYSKP